MLAYFSLAFLFTACALFVLTPLAYRINLLDHPGGRKKHERPVPVIGGVCLFLSLSLTLFLSSQHQGAYRNFEVALLTLIIIGVLDDKHSLPARSRFIAQLLAAIIISVLGDTYISHLGNMLGIGQMYLLWWIGIPFTCFAMIGLTNAVNMMDGIDGLTGCVSVIEFSLLFALAYHSHSESIITLSFIGGLLAFLLFNFPSRFASRHKVFLGDAGSMLIGFGLAWISIKLSNGANAYPPSLMLWIVAIPLMDATHLIINRYLRGSSPLLADRRHIHHILPQLGFTPRQSVLIISAASLIIGAAGIALYTIQAPEWLLFYGFIALFVLYSWLSYKLKKLIVKRKRLA